MLLAADALLWSLSAIALVGYRRKGERQYFIPALAGVLATVPNLGGLPAIDTRFGPIELSLLILVLLLLADVQGLPRRLAAKLRFGLRSREWEFDRRLHIYREQLDSLLLAYRTSQDWSVYRRWQASVRRTGPQLVKRMRSLRPPDADWGQVRDEYADLYERIIALIDRDQSPDDELTLIRGTELKQLADRLRLKYRAEMRGQLDR
jgi:hypothetical protein